MSKGQKLRALVNERLTAAAEEIFELFERTIAEYEEEVHTLKQRNNTQQQLLDQVLEPRVLVHRTGVQILSAKSEEEVVPSLEPPHIKEEPEEEQLQEFPFTLVSVKTEDDEDNSVLYERPTEENREETNGEEWGAEAGCSSDPLTHLHSDSEGHSSDHTDHSEHSEDWTPDESSSKRSYTMINPDSSERENSKTYKCSECEKRFRRKHHLQSHMMTHTGERPFKCSVCQKEFRCVLLLKSHMCFHTGEWPFHCSFCNKGFGTKCNLLVHMRVHTGEKPYKCTVCTKGFAERGHLTIHMRIHTGEKPFSCSVCKKVFYVQCNLNRHMKIHTGEKPFSCSVCKKCFGNRCSLSRHMTIHTGEKPYQCPLCNKCFSCKSDLQKHTVTHTGEKPFSCSVCERRFTQKTHLTRHMKTHSGAGALSPEGGEGSEPKSDSDVHMRDQSEPTPTDLNS